MLSLTSIITIFDYLKCGHDIRLKVVADGKLNGDEMLLVRAVSIYVR